jgi:putative sterol carrier protein
MTRIMELLGAIPHSGYDARLSGTRGTVRFDVAGHGSWRLRIEDGRFDVLDGGGDADLVLTCDEPAFVELIDGTQNFVTALLQGRILAEGRLALALKFHGVLRGAEVRP